MNWTVCRIKIMIMLKFLLGQIEFSLSFLEKVFVTNCVILWIFIESLNCLVILINSFENV
jgi:hypothetical protein